MLKCSRRPPPGKAIVHFTRFPRPLRKILFLRSLSYTHKLRQDLSWRSPPQNTYALVEDVEGHRIADKRVARQGNVKWEDSEEVWRFSPGRDNTWQGLHKSSTLASVIAEARGTVIDTQELGERLQEQGLDDREIIKSAIAASGQYGLRPILASESPGKLQKKSELADAIDTAGGVSYKLEKLLKQAKMENSGNLAELHNKALGISQPMSKRIVTRKHYDERLRSGLKIVKEGLMTVSINGKSPPEKKYPVGYRGTDFRFSPISHKPLEATSASSQYPERHEYARIDREWTIAYAIIHAIHRRDLPPPERNPPAFVYSFHRKVRRYQVEHSSPELVGNIYLAWLKISNIWKQEHLHAALLYALLKSPMDALHIARTACSSKYLSVPSYIIQDCINHVTTVEVENVEHPTKEVLDLVLDSISLFLDNYARPLASRFLNQRTLFNLSKHCDADQMDRLVVILERANCDVTTITKMHMMTRYVAFDRLGSALEILQAVPKEDLQHDAVQDLCCVLLRAPWQVEDLYGLRTRLLSFILELGVIPKRGISNVVLLNAMEAGDRSFAWQSYQVTRQNGLLSNAYTHSALLKGVNYGDDLAAIDSTYRSSKEDGTLAGSPFLASHLLFAMYTVYRRRGLPPFNAMFNLYAEMFDTAPLYELGILQGELPWRHIPQPSEAATRSLAWLLIAWLKENASHFTRVRAVYDRFKEHVSNGNPAIAPLAEQTFVNNAFIMAFGEFRSTLQMCTIVAQNMLKPPLPQPEPAYQLDTGALAEEMVPRHPVHASSQDINDEDTASNPISSPQYRPLTVSPPSHPQPRAHIRPPIDPATFTRVQQPPSNASSQNQDQDPTPTSVSPPDVHTWNALICVFSRHKQLDSAERILTLMQERGIKPDKMSWDRLVAGYVRTQQPRLVVDALTRMGRENFKPDEETVKHLSRVVDRAGLLAELERAASESKGEGEGKGDEESGKEEEESEEEGYEREEISEGGSG